MADDYCDLMDMPKNMCSHCRGLDIPEKLDLIVLHETTARFNGTCGVCGEFTLREGDPMYRVQRVGEHEELWAGTCCVGNR